MALIQSGASADFLTIEPAAKAARVALYDAQGNPIVRADGDSAASAIRFLPAGGVNDDQYRVSRVDRFGGMALASNMMLFSEPFEAAVVSTPGRITVATTTFTQAQTASGGLVFNSANVVTAASAALLTTNRNFARFQRGPIHFRTRARMAHVANAVIELGLGRPASQTVSPTTGAYFQATAGGAIQGVLSFNGVDLTTGPLTMPGSWQSNFYVWDVILDDDEARFIIQDTALGTTVVEAAIKVPATQVRMFDATRVGAFARLHFPTAPATAANLIVANFGVTMLDTVTNKPWPHTLAHMGFGSEIVPTTQAQAANYANTAAPASATLSNTAAGYTTLGGQFQFAAVAGAETDYALFGFTVPAPLSFVCTGIDISTFNMGAAVATTPTTLQWFASPDQTAISLATATNRRVPLGAQSLAVGAAIGAMADRDISRDFANASLVTNPGRIMVLGLKMPVGTATASQIIRGVAAIKGYFE
jgi:hypothetical protein